MYVQSTEGPARNCVASCPGPNQTVFLGFPSKQQTLWRQTHDSFRKAGFHQGPVGHGTRPNGQPGASVWEPKSMGKTGRQLAQPRIRALREEEKERKGKLSVAPSPSPHRRFDPKAPFQRGGISGLAGLGGIRPGARIRGFRGCSSGGRWQTHGWKNALTRAGDAKQTGELDTALESKICREMDAVVRWTEREMASVYLFASHRFQLNKEVLSAHWKSSHLTATKYKLGPLPATSYPFVQQGA